MVRKAVVICALSLTTPAAAADFDWHTKSNRIMIATVLQKGAKSCSALFGFTALPSVPERVLIEKIDAYLLLQDYPLAPLENWLSTFRPALAIVFDKPPSPDADSTKAASAMVAAAKDPSVMSQAEQRYIEGAMAPFRRALEACKSGTSDSFISQNVMIGNGSAAEIEKSFRDDFASGVAEMRTKPK